MASFLIKLDGVAEGGNVRLDLYGAEEARTITLGTAAGTPLRVVSEQLRALAKAERDIGLSAVDSAGGMLALDGIEEVIFASEDTGIEGVEIRTDGFYEMWPVDMGARFTFQTPGAVPARASDRRVLTSLGDMVGSMARAANAENRIMAGASAGRALAGRLNAAAAASGSGPMASLAASLMNSASDLSSTTADLSDARGRLLEQVAKKEEEAKGGDGGGPTPGGGTPPPTLPTPIPPPSPTPGGGGGGGSPSQPDGTDDPGSEAGGGPSEDEEGPDTRKRSRPAGSGSEFRPIDEPCEIRIYYIDGLVITVGKFPDGWFRSLGQSDQDIRMADGTIRRVPDVHNFGDPYSEDPDELPVEVDIDELDRIVAERQAQQAQEQNPDSWESLSWMASLAADMIPIVGQVKGLAEIIIGRDLITGEPLSDEQRIAAGLLTLLPFAGAAIGAGAKSLMKSALRASRAGRQLSATERAAVRELQRKINDARRATGSRPPTVRHNQCPATRPPPPRHPRPRQERPRSSRGRNLSKAGCFAAGTLVRMADGATRPIEQIRPGDRVVARASSAFAPVVAEVLKRVSFEDMPTVEVELESAGARQSIRATHRHPFAIRGRYFAAEDLEPGDVLDSLDGPVRVTGVRRDDRRVAVFNFEVARHHTFFVSGAPEFAAVQVHNCCEALSQRDLKQVLLDAGWELFTNAAGEVVDEPFFKNGKFTGAGGQMSMDQKLSALTGKPLSEVAAWDADKKLNTIRRHLGGATAPDFVAREPGTNRWRIIELKTPREGQDINSYFTSEQFTYDRNRQRVLQREDKIHMSQQMTRRFEGMKNANLGGGSGPSNIRHELVIDLRCGVFSGIGQALLQLGRINTSGEFPSFTNMGSHYTHVRFIRTQRGRTVMTRPFPMPI